MRNILLYGWLALLAVSLCLFFPIWTGHFTWYTDDLINLNIPQRVLLGNMVRSGHLPLWNPYSFAGQPFLASMQSGPLYLPNVVFVVLPLMAALTISYLFHWLLAVCGLYSYLVLLRLRPISAFVGAVVFGTCGFFMAHVMHTQMVNATAWIPVLFALAEAFARSGKHRYALLLSLAYALQIFAGHPQITFYTGLILVPYVMITQKRPLVLCLVLGLGTLLAAVQLVPAVELIRLSIRNAISYPFFSKGSMPPDWWATFVFPFLHGGGYTSLMNHPDFAYWEYAGYCGLLAAAAAFASLFAYRWNRVTAFWVGAAVIGIIMAMGDYTPLLKLLYHVPVFNWFRISARYVLLVDLSVAVLLAYGWDALIRSKAALGILCVTLAAGLASVYIWVLQVWAPENPDFPLGRLQAAFQIPMIIAAAFLLVLAAVWLIGKAVAVGRGPLLSAVLAACILCDNSIYALQVNRYALADKSQVDNTSPVIQYLQKQDLQKQDLQKGNDPIANANSPFRVVSFTDTLTLERGARYGIETINGYDSLYTQTYADYIDLVWSYGPLFRSKSHLDLLNTRYAVVSSSAHMAEFEDALRPSLTRIDPNAAGGATDGAAGAKQDPGGTMSAGNILVIDPSAGLHAENIPLTGITKIQVEYQDPLRDNELKDVYDTSSSPFTVGHLSVIAAKFSGASSNSAVKRSWGADLPPSGSMNNRVISLDLDPQTQLEKIWIRNDLWRYPLSIQHIRFVYQDGSILNLPAAGTIGAGQWKPVFAHGDDVVLQNESAYPRFWAAYEGDWQTRMPDAAVSIIQSDWNTAQVDVNMPSDGQLIWSQLYYPGWFASVDGQKALPILQMNSVCAVALPQGHHLVKFVFAPPSFQLGWKVSAGALLIWLAALLLAIRHKTW